MKPRVFRDGLDWTMRCGEHGVSTWTSSHDYALEAAWGHIAMHHHDPELGLTMRAALTVYDHLVNGCTDHRCDLTRLDFAAHLCEVAR